LKNDPYLLRQKGFAHLLYLVLMPPAVHAFAAVIFGLDADTSSFMLFASALAAAATGAFLKKLKYGPVAAALSGAWPAALAAGRYWYWAGGMPSPGGSAQALARVLGWADAPAAAAVAAALLPCGAVGWLWVRFSKE
jgi:hypothetical protein